MGSEAVKRFIPQREPIIMVDRLVDVNGNEAVAAFIIRTDNFFIDEGGLLAETGLIEHIAQSASAVAGYRAVEAGAVQPPVGYIAEIKKFRCHRRPAPGEELLTKVTFGTEVGGVTLISAETRAGGGLLAETQMKIYVKPEG